MSEKKRVRVYMPQVNTDHFANYMFQVGGPVGPGAMPMMQQSQDVSSDIADLLQMYAQAKGMDQEQLQQVYTSIMQMEPDQQQQVIAQMQQELGSEMAGNPMVAKKGGYIKETKKLLSKKIGGVSTNVTSKDLVGQRLENIKNNIGYKVANQLLNESTEEQLKKENDLLGQAAKNLAMASMPTKDYGGYVNDMYNMGMGIASGKENQFIQDVTDTKMDFRNAFGDFKDQFLQTRFEPGKTTIRKSGDMFENQQMTDNPAQTSTEPPSASSYTDLTSNQLAEQMFGLKNGGRIPSYQNAGTIDIGTGKYDPVTKTITGTDGTTRVADEDEANWIMSQMSFGESPSTTNQASGDNSSQSNTGTGSGVSGWHGGFYWENGVPVASWDQMQQQGTQTQPQTSWGSIFKSPDRKIRIQNNILDMARDPKMIQQFGEALTQFQPDNVYLSKAKGRVNPFGAKVVLKWDYDENGRPVQKEVVEGEEQSDRNFIGGDKDNIMGRMFKGSEAYQDMFQRRGDKAYEKRYGHAPGTSYSESMTPTFADPADPNQGANTISDVVNRGSTGDYSDMTNPDFYENEEGQVPFVPVNPEEVPVVPGYAFGGMPKAKAGKMVIKQQFRPYGSDLAQLYTPAANAVAAGLNMAGLNEQEEMAHRPDFFMPSIPMGPGSMGTKFVGPGMGSESRFNPTFGATGNYADSLYQNEPTFGIAPGMGYQGYNRKNGGMYQAGGEATSMTPGEFYNYALKEKQYFLDNPETWKEDPEMQNADGSFNLCLDCLNVDYNDPKTVEDVVRLINEGHSQLPHHSADVFTASLQKFGIAPPLSKQKYGGMYQRGGVTNYQNDQVYELSDDELDQIFSRGGKVQYF
jgi:hypothetical protein